MQCRSKARGPGLTRPSANRIDPCMEIQTGEDWENAVRAVFRRAIEDPAFRALALSDAGAAFEQAAGRSLPAGSKVRFVEQLEEHVLELPAVVRQQNALSEIDLSRIVFHGFRQQSIPLKFPAGR